MAVRVALTHRTTYKYERPASVGPQVVRLRPAPHNRTPIHSYALKLQPKDHFINWQQDPHGNYLARVVVPEKTNIFEVQVDLVADLESYNPFDFFLEPSAEESPFKYSEETIREIAIYLNPDPMTPALSNFLEKFDQRKRRTVDYLVELNRAVYEAVDYVIRMEPGVQTPTETLTIGKGSCRDSAWLMVQACRHLGLAARFVSGYLIQLEPDERPVHGPAGPETDFTDLHAWCEVYVPGAGWIGLDPTSGLLTAEGHIPLACSPFPGSAAPIEGGVENVETDFSFHMEVRRIIDVPRVTKPYTEEQWQGILDLGHRVDASLDSSDARLTMGGEPTFVAEDNPDAEEWNTEALGADKLARADRLARRLYHLWSKGAVMHHGQGKWYPGEQLPRWAISMIYRKDGQPIWRDESKFALSESGLNYTSQDAELFVHTLIDVLGVSDEGLMEAFEDAWYYMWKERRLPTNVDPLKNNLSDPVERERVARVFRQGLNQVVGYVLPLKHEGTRFESGKWFLRDENCFLIPGDSPMGFRLPLESTPWTAEIDNDSGVDPDPTQGFPPFVEYEELRRRFLNTGAEGRSLVQFQTRPDESSDESSGGPGARLRKKQDEEERRRRAPHLRRSPPVTGESAVGMVKTALCVEAREGILHVFIPPLYSADAYIELCAALERASEVTGLPLQIEGYPPPRDSRLTEFKITPDPGVIEVNVPPVSGWDNLVKQTDELYHAAKQERLTAEKFDVDGKHIGSGGGNHLVLGADTPLSSIFLRRPDVLRSFISFWHNHPSLSYLFSGQFIGPTSQAPRVDEARTDAVYELELAFKQLPEGREVPPWLVDRVLRHLLVDLTGNTHRAEFCIDKLYSPDGSSGRLGLLEMRGFEMPPHHRMANAQQLLVRATLAAFLERPYVEGLAKWGTTLQDRFLLPHFVRHDLHDALSYLAERGFSLDPEWFEPHYQFRFPYYGHIVKDNVLLEVRGALEPWHVLGEESGAGGQARYVDSSLERVQIKVKGAIAERHLVCCNGVQIPLHPTGVRGEMVAGIRYRAWQPPSCLHPTIGIDAPLHLEIYDNWNQRAIAGCTYHVVHPGGRANEDRPINAVAAESRRIARFEHAGHTGGKYEPLRHGVNPHFPMTLDLRLLKS